MRNVNLFTNLLYYEQVEEQVETEKRAIEVPSLASIEGMRTPSPSNVDLLVSINAEEASESSQLKNKTPNTLHHTIDWPSRAPLININ